MSDMDMNDDAAKVISQTKICVWMRQGFGYTTASGVEFTPEQPFQMMDAMDAYYLMNDNPDRFREATREQVQEFFSKEKVRPKRLAMV